MVFLYLIGLVVLMTVLANWHDSYQIKKYLKNKNNEKRRN